MAGLGQKDSSPSHACDTARAFGVSLSHNLVLGIGAGILRTVLDIPGLLELSSRTCVSIPLFGFPVRFP